MTGNCVDCGRLISSSRRLEERRAIGALRHYSHGRCVSCGHRVAKRWLTHPRGSRIRVARSKYAPDPVAVQRLLAGDLNVHVTSAELHEAVLALNARGLSSKTIATQLHISMRTVTRHRAKARDAEQVAA
ncbi:regulatory LuxR family protein [Jatrophihabitans sp. GAS493]|uniref:LuxR C-terminal-related transcriptional regulator n=1 Tax=Jatrophihabitans sp. GAS493 TaxID=1907575 RepID=UPI000BB8985F|nr:LuxR C-terminal-related transcriptional regulator [Jatrophihabitans sp. GAS493]SOD72759.1 regulatory LuxR family protein [Jatrophihabitans sp. GAS493]